MREVFCDNCLVFRITIDEFDVECDDLIDKRLEFFFIYEFQYLNKNLMQFKFLKKDLTRTKELVVLLLQIHEIIDDLH